MLDRKLTFLPHIKKLAVKTKTLFQKLKQTAHLRHGVKPLVVKTIYKAVYEPIMTYGVEAWVHRVNNVHMKRNLRTSLRQVLLSITGAYRTTSFLALKVTTNATPIDLIIKELIELQRLKRNLRQGTKTQIKSEVIHEWQLEWSEAQVGRYTYGLLPDIRERGNLKHMQVNHSMFQLLSGHGDFNVYLHKINKRETGRCDTWKTRSMWHWYARDTNT